VADIGEIVNIGPALRPERITLKGHYVTLEPLRPEKHTDSIHKALGWIDLHNIVPEHRNIEVGYVLYGPTLQRTRGATEAQYLLANYAFDVLGYRRYEWRCNNFNELSKRAAERLGFTFESLSRQHMITKGRNRDTAWYSVLDSEWPHRKAALEAWLDPKNFDIQGGRQIKPLSYFQNRV